MAVADAKLPPLCRMGSQGLATEAGMEKAEGMRRRRSGQKKEQEGRGTDRECHVDILAKGLAKMGDGKANQKIIRNSTNGIGNILDCLK